MNQVVQRKDPSNGDALSEIWADFSRTSPASFAFTSVATLNAAQFCAEALPITSGANSRGTGCLRSLQFDSYLEDEQHYSFYDGANWQKGKSLQSGYFPGLTTVTCGYPTPAPPPPPVPGEVELDVLDPSPSFPWGSMTTIRLTAAADSHFDPNKQNPVAISVGMNESLTNLGFNFPSQIDLQPGSSVEFSIEVSAPLRASRLGCNELSVRLTDYSGESEDTVMVDFSVTPADGAFQKLASIPNRTNSDSCVTPNFTRLGSDTIGSTWTSGSGQSFTVSYKKNSRSRDQDVFPVNAYRFDNDCIIAFHRQPNGGGEVFNFVTAGFPQPQVSGINRSSGMSQNFQLPFATVQAIWVANDNSAFLYEYIVASPGGGSSRAAACSTISGACRNTEIPFNLQSVSRQGDSVVMQFPNTSRQIALVDAYECR